MQDHNEEKVHIKLERHLWPDELAARRRRRLRIVLLVVSLVLAFGLGVFARGLNQQEIPIVTPGGPVEIPETTTNDHINAAAEFAKFQEIYRIVSEKWYFAKDLENPKTTIMDHAIIGMLDQNGDPYSEYMTSQEYENFWNNIDRNFIEIGVQFYYADGYSIVQRVFHNSPAQKAGVMPGDIFYRVDGRNVIDLPSDELSEIVKGKEGTTVNIDFKRGEAIVSLAIVREQVNSTAYAEILSNEIGYLEISSFGSTTGAEVKYYLDYMVERNVTKLIIDLRDNGGGALQTLGVIGSYFVPKGQVLIKTENVDGTSSEITSTGEVYTEIEEIVLLVNENSASASEVLVLALSENLDVPIVGTQTFGKGTVQNSIEFDDHSALKFTVSRWISPKGNWIHDVGIQPTHKVELAPIFYMTYPSFEEEETQRYRVDSVGYPVSYVQTALQFLGYEIDRTDGYFSEATDLALKQYQETNRQMPIGVIDKNSVSSINSSVIRYWNVNREQLDTQRLKAIELLGGIDVPIEETQTEDTSALSTRFTV